MREDNNFRRRLQARFDLRQDDDCLRRFFINEDTHWSGDCPPPDRNCIEQETKTNYISDWDSDFNEIVPPAPEDITTELAISWSLQSVPLLHEVKLHFTNSAAKKVVKVNWHTSQQTRYMEDGSLVMTFHIAHPETILHWLLRYGHQVRVLSPDWLDRQVRLAFALIQSKD